MIGRCLQFEKGFSANHWCTLRFKNYQLVLNAQQYMYLCCFVFILFLFNNVSRYVINKQNPQI